MWGGGGGNKHASPFFYYSNPGQLIDIWILQCDYSSRFRWHIVLGEPCHLPFHCYHFVLCITFRFLVLMLALKWHYFECALKFCSNFRCQFSPGTTLPLSTYSILTFPSCSAAPWHSVVHCPHVLLWSHSDLTCRSKSLWSYCILLKNEGIGKRLRHS